ncbi:hypothetical protein RI844_15720 [Thalassotalea fonticola]|uniref:Lipocalin-like domain-containing protein n=1 Tax=Thalassotalea fonticola TaxID=3065649 RepID=A0ABZ0GM81_9GAMM|nr:hypothetical protein RI844_15720 [Colwelliaceae bacterium S1-1]
MKYLLLFLSIMPCLSMAQNQLIGEWHYDSERTLSELDLSNEYSKKIKKCYEVKMCGDGFYVFDDESYVFTQLMTSGNKTIEGTHSYYNYKVLSSNAELITILHKPIDFKFYSELKDDKSKKKLNELNELFRKANDWEEVEETAPLEFKFFLTDNGNTFFFKFPNGQKEYFYRKTKQ